MELKDILPEKPEFTLTATGEHVHVLRHPTLDDRAKFDSRFGAKNAQLALGKKDWSIISQMVMILLVDKTPFQAKTEKFINDDGVEVTEQILGPQLIRRAVGSLSEEMAVIGALSKAFIGSDPKLIKAVEEELKKNLLKDEKSDGPKSSTSSDQNTDGPLNTLGQEP